MASLKAKQTYSGRRPIAGLPNAGHRQTIGTTRSRLAMHEMEKTIWASLRHWSSCQSFIRRRHNNSAPACSTRWASLPKSNLFVRQMSFEWRTLRLEFFRSGRQQKSVSFVVSSLIWSSKKSDRKFCLRRNKPPKTDPSQTWRSSGGGRLQPQLLERIIEQSLARISGAICRNAPASRSIIRDALLVRTSDTSTTRIDEQYFSTSARPTK